MRPKYNVLQFLLSRYIYMIQEKGRKCKLRFRSLDKRHDKKTVV